MRESEIKAFRANSTGLKNYPEDHFGGVIQLERKLDYAFNAHFAQFCFDVEILAVNYRDQRHPAHVPDYIDLIPIILVFGQKIDNSTAGTFPVILNVIGIADFHNFDNAA